MSSLPRFQTDSRELNMLQSRWISIMDPILSNPLNEVQQIKSISLVANTPYVINHLLGQMQQGWFITDINANARVWRTQPFNSQTLTLESNADVIINIGVY